MGDSKDSLRKRRDNLQGQLQTAIEAERVARNFSRVNPLNWGSSQQEKYETAVDLYSAAGRAYQQEAQVVKSAEAYKKMSKEEREEEAKKNFIQAAQAMEAAGRIQLEGLKEPHDAANTYIETSGIYGSAASLRKEWQKEYSATAAASLQKAIEIMQKGVTGRSIALHAKNLAQLYVTAGDKKRAQESYELAAMKYDAQNQPLSGNQLWLHAADLDVDFGDYYSAIEKYERVAESYIRNNPSSGSHSAKPCFLKAGLCHLATGDMVSVQRALEQYRALDPSFAGQREHRLLVDLAEAVEQNDQQRFAAVRRAYDPDPLTQDAWRKKILDQIVMQIEEADNEFA